MFGMLICFASFAVSYSQTEHSGLSSVMGGVKDQTGALVPDAKVSFVGINLRKEITTDYFGQYTIQLPKGGYKITVSRSGFCDATRSFDLDYFETVILKFVVVPCVHQLIEVYDPTTKQSALNSTLTRPFEEMSLNICSKSKPVVFTIRYGSRIKAAKFFEFLGFSSKIRGSFDGKSSFESKDILPVSILFYNEEIYADRLRFYPADNRLVMNGVQWVGNGKLIQLAELILSPCV